MKLRIILLIALLSLLAALPFTAFAGTAVFAGTLSDADAIYANGRPDNSACNIQIDDILPDKYHYEVRYITVSETGEYDYDDTRGVNDFDIEVAFYVAGTFDALNPLPNCLGSLDDAESINLEAGIVYALAVTSYDVPIYGEYSFELTGPGDITEVFYDGTCAVPLPVSAVISAIPAGAPAFYAADASTATGFNIPAGNWYTYGTSGDFTHVWIACQATPVWVPSNAVAP